MFHPYVQRFIVLAAGLLFLAYAIATDEDRETSTADRKPRDGANGDGEPSPPEGTAGEERGEIANLVDAAHHAGRFGTWSLAVKQAGLVPRLEGPGPFTVFAPTDDAFGKLGESLDSLLANQDELRRTLECHVVDGRFLSTDLTNNLAVTSLGGTRLDIGIEDGTVRVGASTVVEADLTASNGVIHGIDAVLPAETPST